MPDSKNLAGLYELRHRRMHGETIQPAGSVAYLGHEEASSLLGRGLVKPAPAPEAEAPKAPESPSMAPTDPPPADAPPAPPGSSSPPIPSKAEKSKR